MSTARQLHQPHFLIDYAISSKDSRLILTALRTVRQKETARLRDMIPGSMAHRTTSFIVSEYDRIITDFRHTFEHTPGRLPATPSSHDKE